MKISKLYFYILLLGSPLIISSCKKPEPVPVGEFKEGVFIINEGLQNGSGTISFYNKNTQEVKQDVFGAKNNGESLGAVVQSMTILDEKGYIVVHKSNKIVVVDANSFAYITELTDFKQPRYFLPVNDQEAYISEWGANGTAGAVKVLNLNSLAVTKTIPVGQGPEQMVLVGDSVFVAISGGANSANKVMIIKTTTHSVTDSITVGHGPNSLQKDDSGDVWVLCKGYNDLINPPNSTPGRLDVLRNKSVIFSLEIPYDSRSLVIDDNRDVLYFANGEFIYRWYEFDLVVKPLVPFITRSVYSLGIEPANGKIYAGDANDGTSKGNVYVFDKDGVPLDTFQVGILPGYFVFH